MNQKLSLSLFFSGLATFLSSIGEVLSHYQSWNQMTTPNEIGHIIIITASFIMTVVGALGTQLPRSNKNERVTDQKLNELNNKEDE